MEANEIKKKIDSVRNSMSRRSLKKRWNDDLNLYLLDEHKMKGVHGALKDRELPGVYNVTSSDPQTYMDRVTSIISRAEPKLRIVSPLKDSHIELIDNWWKCVLYSANKLYEGNAGTPIYPSLAFFTNLRGYAASRNTIYKDGKETVFEILPLDVYDLFWKKYGNKLSWASILSMMEAEQALEDYNVYVKESTETHDFWDKDGTEYVLIGGNVFPKEHTYINEVPISICPVVTTPQVSGDNTKRDSMVGESLYHAVRQTIKERNDILSIIKTHAMLGMRPPLVHKTEGSEGRELQEYPTWGTVIEQFAEEGLDSLKFSDMANTNAMFFNMMDGEYQRGTVPSNEYGGLNFQLSSLALDTLSGQRSVVFLPRQSTLETLYKSIFNQMMNQFIEGKFSTSMIDESGKEIEISFSQLVPLKDKFRIDFTVDVESPEQEASNYEKAVMAMNAGLPDDFIVRNVFKAEDPEKLLSTMQDERLMKELPELRLTRAYDRAMKESQTLSGEEKEAKLIEAKLLKARIEQVIREMAPQGGA